MTRDRSSLTPGLLAALGFVSAVGPFATDMYLASFTDIAEDLGTVASSVQLTLTAFLIGIGTGQLVLGPLSDRWGRRPVLLSALAVFALSGAATVFSPRSASSSRCGSSRDSRGLRASSWRAPLRPTSAAVPTPSAR